MIKWKLDQLLHIPLPFSQDFVMTSWSYSFGILMVYYKIKYHAINKNFVVELYYYSLMLLMSSLHGYQLVVVVIII